MPTLIGDELPDVLMVGDGVGPWIARNPGNNHHWVALDLDGRWGVKPKLMRTNPHGWGRVWRWKGRG
jgi:hypothetical protein